MKALFTLAACVSVVAVFVICIFLFANGLPAIMEIGPWQFLSGTEWRPNNDVYGIFPMIVGSVYTTVRGTDWNFICGLYGVLLSKAHLSAAS